MTTCMLIWAAVKLKDTGVLRFIIVTAVADLFMVIGTAEAIGG